MSTDATIIVVENETDARVTMCRMLEDAGYKVIGLKRGIDALGIIGRSPFNAVITDIRLPDVGGLEILELAKEMNPDAAVIMMTSNASVETTVDAVDHGAYAYFVKPINPDELKTTIANALKQQRLSLENKRLIESLQHSRRLLSEANEELRNEITERKQAEEALRESEERYRDLFENANDLIQSVTPDGHFRYVNTAWRNVLGYSKEEVANLTLWDIIHPDYINHCREIFQKVMSGETANNVEAVFVTKDGRVVPVEGSVNCRFEGGKPVATRGIFRDITERKQAEEKIQQQNEFLNNILNSLTHPFYVVDVNDYTVKMANPAAKLGNLSENPTCYALTHKIVKPCGSVGHVCPLEEVKKTKKPVTVEHIHYDGDGNARNVEVHGYPVFDTEGNVIQMIEYCLDITERKQLEEALRENEEKLRLMFESAGEGIVVIDLDNKILDVNQVAVRMHGYDSREELIGRSALDLSAEEDRARASSNTRRRLEEGLRGAIEYTLLRKDGSKFPAEVNMATIRDAHGIPIGFIGIFVDITERKRIEKEIQEKNEELAEASRAKSEFLAHMSHELRTPLNVIIGFSELMMDELPGEVNEEQGQCLSDILGSGQHLLSLINDILDLSKIESGKMELKLTNIALPSVIESLRREIMPVIGKREQSLDVEVEEGLPLVRGDKVKVRQVLLNLLSNAAKFTPDGGKLKVEAIRNGDWCQVSVVDRGIGIKKEDQEKIFEPFSQLDDLQAEGKGGTGLGLTLARQIIEKHGGRMWVESKYRKGSKFSFTQPLATADEPHPRENRH